MPEITVNQPSIAIPIAIIIAVILVVWLIFKLLKLSFKLFFKLLINTLIGVALLFVFNYVLGDILNLQAFKIPIVWWTALVTGVLGVPGVLILLVLNFIGL